MTTLASVAIVGASLAGVRAAEALRSQGYDGRLIMIGDEPHLPYDRPPLSKEVLRGEWGPERIPLLRDGVEALTLDLRIGRRAIGLDVQARKVRLDDGSSVPYQRLVIATGTQPRRFPVGRGLAGVHVLRTLDDALALRGVLARVPRVLVIGAGFIGLEVAASCRARGLEVTVVEPQSQPLAAVLGEAMGRFLADLHRDHGVNIRTGTAVAELRGDERVESARLSDGTSIPTDVVVVGIGVTPATDWLADSGLELDDGVLCDERCRTSVPGIVAAGDVARWLHPRYGKHVRVEHWMNAAEQGAAAARTLLLGSAAPVYAPVPSFWSDQYDVKVQFAGMPLSGSRIETVSGDLADRRFVALYGDSQRVTGVLAVRRAAAFVRYSELLARGVGWDEVTAEKS